MLGINRARERRRGRYSGMTAAKKAEGTKAVTPTVQPQPATAAPVAPVAPSTQDATLDKLKSAWVERKVDLSKLTATPDGKFLIVKVDANWPTIRIGASGGIDLPEIKSYPRAWDAAVEGDKLLAKQVARAQKKSASAPATPKPAVEPEPKQTPASEKAAAHKAIEDRIQQQA